MPRVIISSGHTSTSPGTEANGLREVDLARKIARSVLPQLRGNGVIALAVPPELDLASRIEWINKTGFNEDNDDLALEIHINDGGKRGIEIWYEGEGGNKSEAAAKVILQETVAESALPAVGARSEYDHELGSLAFIHETNTISALIECGYIDNEEDAKFLKEDSNLELLGKGIAKGILKYLKIEYKEPQQAVTKIPAAQVPAPASTTKVAKPRFNPYAMPPVSSNAPIIDDFGMSPGNGFNSFAGGGFGQGVTPGGGMQRPGAFPAMPSREERKEFISKNYVKILGREPNQNDLNYFLNIGITEDQLIKKMIDSQEHADLVKSRQEVLRVKKKYNEQQEELQRLRAKANDQEKIISQLQQSIEQKNTSLSDLQSRITNLQKIEAARSISANGADEKAVKYRGTFLDRLFRVFSDLFD